MTRFSLTPAQQRLYDHLERYTRVHPGSAPTFAEMAVALGLKSRSGVHRLITGLEERGLIRRMPHRRRAIEVLRPSAVPVDLGRHYPRVLAAAERAGKSLPEFSRDAILAAAGAASGRAPETRTARAAP